MSRMLRVGPLVTAALIAFVAHGESPAEWTRHASVRWDLGSVKDVDFVGDTGLLLAIDGYWDDADAPGFIVWDPDTKRLVRSIPADVAGIVVHTVSLDGSRPWR